MKIAILAITPGGRNLAEQLASEFPGAFAVQGEGGVAGTLASLWESVDGFICIMAAGIVVRAVAPLLQDKMSDPCIVVLDEKGRHAVSLLSGHLGGGNDLALRIAALSGGEAVITTASDTLGLPALDLWAAEQQLVVEDGKTLTRASAKLVSCGEVTVYAEFPVASLPRGLRQVTDSEGADLVVSNRADRATESAVLQPRNLVVGVGCNRGTPVRELEEALTDILNEAGLSILAIRNLASMDLKNDEPGLLEFAAGHNWRLDFYDKNALNRVRGLVPSGAVMKAVGASGVAEPAALLSAGNGGGDDELLERLLIRKKKWRNVTMAVAEADFTLSVPVRVRLST